MAVAYGFIPLAVWTWVTGITALWWDVFVKSSQVVITSRATSLMAKRTAMANLFRLLGALMKAPSVKIRWMDKES